MKNPIWKPAAAGNYESGRRNAISRITFHHIVGDAPAAIARFQTAGVQVSATYVIGSDGTLYQCVKEGDTPYTDANADSNSRAITIEHAGPPYAEAMYKTSVGLVGDLIARYGIKDFKRHRDVSDTPTACPGQLDVERIVNEAKGAPMQPTPKQVGDTYRFMTGLEISQKDLDFYISAPRTIYDLIYALGPDTNKKVKGYTTDSTVLKPGKYIVN